MHATPRGSTPGKMRPGGSEVIADDEELDSQLPKRLRKPLCSKPLVL